MIRRFLSVGIFCATVLLAAFGQHIFNRDDLIEVAHHVQQNAPRHAHAAWIKTDAALASLVTEAGTPNINHCYIDDYNVYKNLHAL